jgi:orotidine-5'-phosphate decarboxylase
MQERNQQFPELEVKKRPPFIELLEARQKAVNSVLCVGLDPVIENIPNELWSSIFRHYKYSGHSKNFEESYLLTQFNRQIIQATHPFVSAYKPNVAFYERYGKDGTEAIEETIEYVREADESIPIILDAKRADIGATNKGYADMLVDSGADAITVNPYFGIEGEGALDPFLELKDKGIIILCRTSNPEASRMQDQIIKDKELGEVPYYVMVADMAEQARQKNPNVGIVVGATVPEQLKKAREVFKGNILVPGLGKQGGRPEDLLGAYDERGLGVIANNSSAIIHASTGEDFAEKAAEAARDWRDKINQYRHTS